MRYTSIKRIVEEYYNLLNIDYEEVNVNSRAYIKIKNWKSINLALYKLNEFDFIGESVNKIFDMGANFAASTETTSIYKVDYDKFLNMFNIVKAKCEAIIDSNNSNMIDEENDLYVRLPDDLKELDDLEDIVNNINLCFNQCPKLRDTYEKIIFKRVDTGSSWIVLSIILSSVPIGKAINYIADFIKKCYDIGIQRRTIRKMDLEYLMQKAEFDKKQSAELAKKIKENIVSDDREIYLKAFKEIFKDDVEEISPEDENKIVMAMSKMIDLQESGVEFYPSDKVDERILQLFPKFKEIKKLNENKRRLGDGNDKKQE